MPNSGAKRLNSLGSLGTVALHVMYNLILITEHIFRKRIRREIIREVM
jgi:hypothetical protein